MEIFEVPRKGEGRRVVVFGAPYDATTIYRRGSAKAPAAIRAASVSIETFSMRLRRDLGALNLRDAGDLPLAGPAPRDAVERVAKTVQSIVAEGAIPIMIGGEHTISLGAVGPLLHVYPDLNIVVVDAHFDLRDEWEGAKVNHATWARRAAEAAPDGAFHFLGVRSALPEEIAYCETRGFSYAGAPDSRVPGKTPAGSPVYLSLDYDGLDPSVFPATGNPEPLGLKTEDLLSLFGILRRHHVVGMDFVEYNPELDNGSCAVTAAWFIREALLEIYGGE
jgi:agmatinase